jgi:ATPase subunit of ABC transporter with duplicated ATPase domains
MISALNIPPGSIRRHDRPERRRQDHPAEDDHRAGKAPTAVPSGSARRSRWAYADQTASRSTREKTVWEQISGGEETLTLGARTMNSRGYVSSFNFLGPDQQKKVGVLSGGERNRVHLAKTLTQRRQRDPAG